jgi:hydroxymethylbilane synthase
MFTPSPLRPLRLGTRASPLAMAQAHMVREALCTAHGWAKGDVAIVPVTATGDRITDRALADVGGKALWTKELDGLLGAGAIDIAVHSMKDVETVRPASFTLAAMLPRADVRDRLVVRRGIDAVSLAKLPTGARIGTSSPRRAAQLLALRPDFAIGLIRGNVATRLEKLESGDFDATLLAAAGLDRLGMAETGIALAIDEWLPAAAQGAIGVEARGDDAAMVATLRAIAHRPTMDAVFAERTLLAALGGDCRSPIAAHAAPDATGQLWLRAEILAADGRVRVAGDCPADDDAIKVLAHDLLGRAPAGVRALFGG